jgi:fermentation-respiration switch protein FrsA (DUF1100 family)
MLEYRGYGGNRHADRKWICTDARAALGFLEHEGVAPNRLVLMASRSAPALPLNSPRSDVAGVILEAPFTSVAEVAQCHFPYIPAARLVIDRFDSRSRIGRVRAPILVLHGERDRVVPIRFGRALFDAAPEPKEGWFVPEAGHEDLARYGGLDAVVAFIERRLGG